MVLKGETTTRIICGYNPCGKDRPNSGTVYHQQQQYLILKRGCLTCPRVEFREDLVEQLQRWRAQGDKLIVCLDANEDVYKKSIGKALTSVNGLVMKEVVGTFTGKQIGPTYLQGSKSIDAVWVTSDIQMAGTCIMPAGYRIGDHCLFVIDFMASLLIGTSPKRIVRPQTRRLNCKILGAVEQYNKRLEEKILRHRLIEQLGQVHVSDIPQWEKKQQLDKIDAEGRNYMKNSEKRCWKIKAGRIPFSPKAAKLIWRVQVYKSLLKFVRCRGRNCGNLRWAAYRAGIENLYALTEADILA
jgi:hypothetical protein